MAPTPRLIKKYPNRRLYDTGISSYVTLEDVRQLALDGEEFEVREAATGKDLTRSVLLQVIAEHEQQDQPLLTVPLLRRFIRLQGDALQVLTSPYLERSLDVFMDQQEQLRRELDGMAERNRVDWTADRETAAHAADDDADPEAV